MPESLLFTKLYSPPLRPGIVPRTRLVRRLNEGLERGARLTLISASAGFGKTTLVREWIAGCGRPVAWLSLDEEDNNAVRFLAYLVAALQTIQAGMGEGLLDDLQSPQPPQAEAVLTALLNKISMMPGQFTLVLDDYHTIDSKPVDRALTFLLDHQPPQMHLAITTREDPDLPLARLRARGQLTELRTADLRFTSKECADFLNRVMGLNLADEDIAALEARTEGWIAGLQLAALSLQGREDITGFLQAFTGSHRYVLDYLVDEVLRRQPEQLLSFLLQTAILDRLYAPLCNAVTERKDGKEMLDVLEHNNLFVIPLDDRRQWYRYHPLFADVLQEHLSGMYPEQVANLHRRASEWFEKNAMPDEAIRHALAARDFARAAGLIELVLPAMNRSRQFATLLGWLKALPDELVRLRPVLSAWYASVLMSNGANEGVEARLRDAERWLEATAYLHKDPRSPTERMVVVDEEEFHLLAGKIALIRAGQALGRGDIPETVKNAQRVLDFAPEDNYLMLGGAASQLGLAAWTNGDLETARRRSAEGMENLRLGGYISPAIGGARVLADIQIAQGFLHEAMTTYERALQWAAPPGAPVRQGAADMYVGMSALHYEHNHLQTAATLLETSRSMGDFAGLQSNPYRWRAVMARICEAQGDLDGALELLADAERLYDGAFAPNVRPIAARKARIWVTQGRFSEALGWAREQGLSDQNEPDYLHEFEYMTLARLLLALYQGDRANRSILTAVGLLERLHKNAEARGGKGSVIEILILQALACYAQSNIPAALHALQKALSLGEPEGYVRTFVDEGPLMAQLLLEAKSRGVMPDYAGRLLDAFKEQKPGDSGETQLVSSTAVPPAAQQGGMPLPEPLSSRELDVLRLFKTELSGPEIAGELVIALSTLRTHTKSIYSKLGVNNRRSAVKRAIESGLI